ncbi:hypothetical protein FRZ67_14360 [Panacibacter ginsenosidivorans]|uniref:Uncharacterized protein n=1 Tax=Panacibacter ginsenosidivorans TaxID=1813871 RepID=A0A5B8VB04_9BACT|nr:hypothetical protein [Panacibacter ginsenosidivorans]QEC68429.1 hypothetical protein FRZ67_14360 [Panacibacter ginsenosidivorans]
MKTEKLIFTSITAAAVCLLACSKENSLRNNNVSNASFASAQPENVVTNICDQFSYGDTIFYPQELPNDYIIHTLTPLSGTFGCFPDELKMNPLNGDIDITEGETGLKYIVWFVPTGTTDTCRKFITVSGIDYTDSIYTLKNKPGVAKPVYNSTPGLSSGSNAEFDDGHDDDDGDGFLDEPPTGQEVIPQGVALDKSTGAINLRQTIANGALGPNPLPGTFKDFVLNYRISDKSVKTLNKLSFRLYYFQNKTQIPARLKKQLAAKKSQVILNDGSTQNFTLSAPVFTSITNKNGTGEVKCRPPYIIVVQQ